MAIVKSTWTHKSIPNNGIVAAADWLGAGTLALNEGTLSVKNDETRVYFALDVMSDKSEGPLANDYYWFIFEMDSMAKSDAMFNPWPNGRKRLGVSLMEGPNILPAIPPAASHRTWTISLDLAHAGNTAFNFALRPVSATPAFTDDSPLNPMNDFADFHQVVLAAAPGAAPNGMIDLWRLMPDHSLSL